MCGVCIGGFCIPYTALAPMLLIVLQWVVSQLAKVGIEIPDFVAKRLAAVARFSNHASGEMVASVDGDDVCSDLWCFCRRKFSRLRKATEGVGNGSSAAIGANSGNEVAESAAFNSQEDKDKVETQAQRSDVQTMNANHLQNVQWCMPCS